MIYRYSIFILLFIVSCKNKNNNSTSAVQLNDSTSNANTASSIRVRLDDAKIEELIDSLRNLDLVKDATQRIYSASMGSRNISFMPDSVAYPNGEFYIAVGDNKPDRFETFINFYININTWNIRVYDVVREDTVDVNEYARRLKESGNQ